MLITRSNTPDRVGYVAVANRVLTDTFLPDLVWRLIVDESRVSREYLVDLISSPTMRARITAIAKGTSRSMQKINRANLGALTIPVPAPETQLGYVEPIMSLSEACKNAEAEAQQLRVFRSNLLTALLSGEHEIPESYDELVEVVS